MPKDEPSGVVVHGLSHLASVTVNAYNAELRSGEAFVGDRASKRSFQAIVDEWRERLRQAGQDPFGDKPTAELSKKALDKILVEGDPEAAGVLHGAIEQFAAELCTVIVRFLKLKAWRETQRIVVGGGVRASRIGELAIGRASVLLKAAGHSVEVNPIHHHPDEAALLGAVQLAPLWMFAGHDGILAVDVGGSHVRVGSVQLNLKGKKEFSKPVVHESEVWRYVDEPSKPTRDEAVERIASMLGKLARHADKHRLKLAPFVGIACPGVIKADGSIERGGQNLPGNWESSRFNLPNRIRELLPTIGVHETMVVMHNDAVVQGLSEVPLVQDVDHWAALTIGTGLGNAAFTNRSASKKKSA
jgi:predicted NBD/HSP70 family sugar kinase